MDTGTTFVAAARQFSKQDPIRAGHEIGVQRDDIRVPMPRHLGGFGVGGMNFGRPRNLSEIPFFERARDRKVRVMYIFNKERKASLRGCGIKIKK